MVIVNIDLPWTCISSSIVLTSDELVVLKYETMMNFLVRLAGVIDSATDKVDIEFSGLPSNIALPKKLIDRFFEKLTFLQCCDI